MALTVETGAGLANSDSYVSLADADSYLLAHGGAGEWSSWFASSDTDREEALRQAAQDMDQDNLGRWRGRRVLTTQALAWPRSLAYDEDSYVIASDAVPVNLKRAQAVLAAERRAGNRLFPTTTETRGIKEESVSVGPISETIVYSGVKPTTKGMTLYRALLRGLVDPTGVMQRA